MAILTGFPPSNTISPGPRIPEIVPTKAKVSDLEPGEKFANNECEFCMIKKDDMFGPTAICYKVSRKSCHNTVGEIYGFSKDLEVIWFKKVY